VHQIVPKGAPHLLTLVLSCLGAAVCDIAAAATPLGGEFLVSTRTASHQYHSRMSMTPDGDFVVTWTGAGQDGSGFGIVARRFDASGAAVGAEFVVNTYTFDEQQYSAVSVNEADVFVVVWRSPQDGDQTGIVARRFDTSGALGAEFQVNTNTAGAQSFPDVAMGQGGGFFVVWQSDGQDGDQSGIFARRHNGSGIPQATEFQVNALTVGSQDDPRIAIAEPSSLIVVWSTGAAVFGRRLGQTGVVGAEFQVHQFLGLGTTQPALAPTGDGGFIVVWHSSLDGGSTGISARRFDSVGAPLTGEFQVNAFTLGYQGDAEVAGNGTDFVVVWSSTGEDGDAEGIFARRLNLAGLVGVEFQVNLYTPYAQRAPSVGIGDTGQFVVVWDGILDGYDNDVLARRFTALDLAALDVDGDGSTDALTDGLLVLRFLFGFTGSTLTTGAVDTVNCTRCDAASIVSYLSGLGLVLDIDDDGELVALTDGLLVLRFLFGFTGTTLTDSAVDADCSRCDAAAIVPYLQSLL
jgi:hypothetical protein